MEMPHLGQNCSEKSCNKLDFLPMKCDACSKIFCNEHYRYTNHNCPSAYQKDVQVPVCPLCSIPIPVGRGQLPDIVVGTHIDSECQSDPAKSRRKVFTNKCSYKGCKTKEIVPVLCSECKLNYCLKHRHTADHKCEGKNTQRKLTMNAAYSRATQRNGISSGLQCSLDEDEALARALQLSLQEPTKAALTQEELDRELALQLQQQEQTATAAPGPRSRQQGSRDRCRLS